jgi:hypothetical protein
MKFELTEEQKIRLVKLALKVSKRNPEDFKEFCKKFDEKRKAQIVSEDTLFESSISINLGIKLFKEDDKEKIKISAKRNAVTISLSNFNELIITDECDIIRFLLHMINITCNEIERLNIATFIKKSVYSSLDNNAISVDSPCIYNYQLNGLSLIISLENEL